MPSAVDDRIFEFGEFRLDAGERVLRRGDEPVSLPPKVFDTLCVLVENCRRIVERGELMDLVWSDTFVEDGNLNVNISTLRKTLGRKSDGSEYIETVPRRGYRFSANVTRQDPHGSDHKAQASEIAGKDMTLAVLPFSAVGLEPGEEYLTLGLADALITQLSRSPALAVRPTSSVRHIMPGDISTEIGARLGVGSVLEGTLQKSGDRIRVTAQLVDLTSGHSLWAEKFLFDFEDIMVVQDEIAGRVAETMLRSLENAGTGPRRQPEAHVYRLYLKGRFYSVRHDPSSLPMAVSCFGQAIAADPGFADAHAALAEAYLMLSFFGEPRKLLPLAKNAAVKAVELDRRSPDALVSLGIAKRSCDWDWKGAETDLQAALALNYNNPRAHFWYGLHHAAHRRFAQALAELTLALHLDPQSGEALAYMGLVNLCMGNAKLGLELASRARELDPAYLPAGAFVGQALMDLDRYTEAINLFEEQHRRYGSPLSAANLAHAHSVAGNVDAAHILLTELEQTGKTTHVSPLYLALVKVGLGEIDQAWDELERSREERDFLLPPWISTDRRFEVLRSDARFDRLMELVGLA